MQRSLREMRDRGYQIVEGTEHFNHFSKHRNDLMGFCDIFCVGKGENVAVQTTSGSNTSTRIKKILSLDTTKPWLENSQNRILVHGWRKLGARGKRKEWRLKESEITLKMISAG